MIIVLFRSKLTPTAAATGYGDMSDEMVTLAKSMPGFIDVKSFKADDGERLTVVWWEDEATLRAWREQPRHREAQRMGRAQWYEYYKMDVATVVRRNDFDRPDHARESEAAVQTLQGAGDPIAS